MSAAMRAVLPSPVRAAIAAGAVVVTPNNRMARHLTALHDREQRAEGRVVWPAPTILPWSAWLERLWLDVLVADCRPEPPRRVSSSQSAYLWSHLVAAEGLPLMDERGASELAAKAWSLVHAWGSGGPSWRGWSGDSDDVAVFARWAESYRAALSRLSAVDDAGLPDWLASCAAEVPAWRKAQTAMVGFIEYSPQAERLLAAMSAVGMRELRVASLADAGDNAISRAQRTEAATPRDEVARALHWARARALADPDATIVVAIEDLDRRRAEVRALADEILCPALQSPGHEEAPRPYNLSLGVAAADVPLIATALDLIALAHAPLPMARAATLVRSPYLAAAGEDWHRRARLEDTWLREGWREVSLAAVVATAGAQDRAFAPVVRAAESGPRGHLPLSPRAWTEAWRALLESAGWPGDRTLSSVEWQGRSAWDELLAEFSALGSVAPPLRRGDAITALVALARATTFQAESPPAPIQIMGVLEAAGLPVDALWIAGLAADAWPPAPQPNPLLPLAWQRERNVPRSTASRELEYARALVTQWASAASEVVFSYSATSEEHRRTISSLALPAAVRDEEDAGPTTPIAQFDVEHVLEAVVDDSAPPLAEGSAIRGGASLIEAQGDCPFKAVARFRLRVDTWPAPLDGFSAMERGTLVHAAVAAFWRDVGNHATLIGLPEDELARRIDTAVATAVECIPAPRRSRLPPVVAAGEAARLARVVRSWLDEFERGRPPFSVAEVEASRPLALGGLLWSLRLDRIDALEGGGMAIIDYKTGKVAPPPQWFDMRPMEPQLGLYWLSQQGFDPSQPVRALAYAVLRPGEMKAVGLAGDAAAWPQLSGPSQLRRADLPDWTAIETQWRHSLAALAAEVREGHAAVAPRDTVRTCRECRLQALCRIGASVSGGENGDA
jgi:probable DNA repair protein